MMENTVEEKNVCESVDGLKKTVEYYDLVEIKHLWTYQVFHIPACFFPQEFLDSLPYSDEIRDDEFFACPICGRPEFFSGLCEFCEEDNHPYIIMRGKEYQKYQLQKHKFKERFLKMVLSGREIPDRFKVVYVRSV
jgi:hypothetical protein